MPLFILAAALQINVGGSLMLSSGNSQALTVGAQGGVKYGQKDKPLTVSLDTSYLRVNGDYPNERISADISGEHKIGKSFAPYSQFSYHRDFQSGLYRQFAGEGGMSFNALDTEKKKLSVSLALTAVDERQLGRSEAEGQFWGSTTRLKQRWPLGSILSVDGKSVLLWSFRDGLDWRLNHQSALMIGLSKIIHLEVTNEISYRRLPAPGKKATDVVSLVSIVGAWPAKN